MDLPHFRRPPAARASARGPRTEARGPTISRPPWGLREALRPTALDRPLEERREGAVDLLHLLRHLLVEPLLARAELLHPLFEDLHLLSGLLHALRIDPRLLARRVRLHLRLRA